jgi:Uma2 family endonuclease
MAGRAPRRMTLAEFLDWDDGTDTRYELIEGEVVAMAPPMPAHAIIVPNLARSIGDQLQSPCVLLMGAGTGVVRRGPADSYFEPDLLVTCTPIPAGTRYIDRPRLVVEVLSPGTRRYDRDTKLDGYRAIPTVAEIIFVWSDERRVQLWRRDGERWIVEDAIGDAALRLDSVDATVPLAAIYDNVPFDEPAPGAAPRQRRRR